ncbi:MAG: diguanylate cyclase domain-containing protein, partial [Microthrixaceae bacterium]
MPDEDAVTADTRAAASGIAAFPAVQRPVGGQHRTAVHDASYAAGGAQSQVLASPRAPSAARARPAASAAYQADLRPAGLSPNTAIRSRIGPQLATAVAAPVLGAVIGTAIALLNSDLWLVALAVVALGAAIGVAGSLAVWSRLRSEVDEPVETLRVTAARLAAGEPGGPIHDAGDGALAPLAVALDRAGQAVTLRTDRLARQAEWGEASGMIIEALEFAQDETEAFEVASRALAMADSDRSAEMLASTGPDQRMMRVAEHAERGGWGCPVQGAENCLALRRGQVVIADSSLALNACPRLRERAGGPCSAVCMPVGVAGQSIGVLTAIGADRVPPDLEYVDRLSAIARQVGNRVESLRALEQSREEAATDGLTGLPNRRVLESQLEGLLERGVEFIAVLADLDKFKSLNDTYGHEAGDRALQLFARVLQDNVRGHDLLARVGGEEFVAAYPDMSVPRSVEAIQR